MSQQVDNPGENTPDQDPYKQLKGEMNRKFEKNSEALAAIARQQQELIAALQQAQSRQAPQPAAEGGDIGDLFYSDPKKAAAQLQEQAVAEAERRIQAKLQQEQQTAATMNALANEYPELADTESELVKVANEILSSVPQNERNNTAYRYAVREAAGRLELKPRSKRDPEEGGFVSPSHQPSRRRSRSDSQVVDAAKDFASAIGLDLSNPAAREAYLSKVKGR